MQQKIFIQPETEKNPISLIGRMSGICYGSDISNDEKNYKRGLNILESGHDRAMEFVQVFMYIDGYSARTIRQLYTHIGGAPTRLQASTRYIDYSKHFDFVVPESVAAHDLSMYKYVSLMKEISETMDKLIKEFDVPVEDASMLLPLGMKTSIVYRTNLRQLIDMSHHRLCTRAYWEFQDLVKELCKELSNYSPEWELLVNQYFKPKCEAFGKCTEHNSCNKI